MKNRNAEQSGPPEASNYIGLARTLGLGRGWMRNAVTGLLFLLLGARGTAKPPSGPPWPNLNYDSVKAPAPGAPTCNGAAACQNAKRASCLQGAEQTNDPEPMVQWTVSEPAVNVWLFDAPFSYKASRGKPVSFKLFYKNQQGDQNNADNGEVSVFSVGTHWYTPWRSYLQSVSGESSNFWVYPGDGTATKFTLDQVDYHTQGKLSQVSTTNVLFFPSGARNIYGFAVTNAGTVRYFLTMQADPQENGLQFQYVVTNGVVRLNTITDPDNRTITFQYATGTSYSNLVTMVTGPYGLTNTLQYDSCDRLTNITDIIGLSSRMEYTSAPTPLSALMTPYGTNKFTYFSTTNQFNAVKVTELDVRSYFYLYYAQVDGGKVPASYSAYVPNTINFSLTNTFDTNNADLRNSFCWSPRQYDQLSDLVRTNLNAGAFNVSNLTSADYLKARQWHWLLATNSTGTNTGRTLSLQRDVSPDGSLQGQIHWFDYANKAGGAATNEGTMFKPRFVAWTLPNGESRFICYDRNPFGHPTNQIETYTDADSTCKVRTNQYLYDTNNIDLIRHVHVLDGGVSRLVSSNAYNGCHQVLTNFDALGNTNTYVYNSNRQLLITRTPAGLSRSNYYQGSGTWSNFLSQQTDIEIARSHSYTYSNGYVLTHTDPRGLNLTHTRDALGRLVKTTHPDSTSVSYTYTNLDLGTVVDRVGATTGHAYDGFRQKIRTTNALAKVTYFEYCNCGTLDQITDPLQKATLFSYDLQGRLTATAYPGGHSVTKNLDLMGRITNTLDGVGRSVTNTLNNQRLLINVARRAGPLKQVAYNIDDQPASIVDANGVTTYLTNDVLNRLTSKSLGTNSERYGYSPVGRVAQTNQAGEVTRFVYDAAGRKTAETNGNGEWILYSYSPAGDLLTMTDCRSNTTRWGYDIYGRATSKTNANGAEVLRYQYDANGRLTNRWSLAKGNTGYSYDSPGNLTDIHYPSGTTVSMQYDANNRMTKMVDAIGTTLFSYTDFGALLSEDGPWGSDSVSYGYTSNQLRSSLTLQQPSGSDWIQTYGYDLDGRRTNIVSPAGSFSYQYDPTRTLQVAKLTLPNASVITNQFDSLARLLGTSLRDSGGTLLNSHTYAYDAANRRTSQTRTLGDSVSYTYDAAGQLKAAVGWESGGTTNRAHEQFGYVYDGAGNLNYRTNGDLVPRLVQTFNVDNLNQLTSITRSGPYTVAGTTWGPATNVTLADNGNSPVAALRYADATFARTNVTLLNGTNTFTAVAQDAYGRTDTNTVTAYLPTNVTFAYDGNGNLTTNGTRFFEYDDENQLVRVTEPDAWKSEFAYDGIMRRRIRKEYVWQSALSSWQLVQEVRYVYDGMLVIQERNSLNLPTVTYTGGQDLSGSRQGAGCIGGLLARTDSAQLAVRDPAAHAFYHADGNGNITCLINNKQRVVARYLYDPFGNIVAASGTLADANLYRFCSKEWHENSGLVLYGGRYYSANFQRWINSAPVTLGRLVHKDYTFSRNAPLQYAAQEQKNGVFNFLLWLLSQAFGPLGNPELPNEVQGQVSWAGPECPRGLHRYYIQVASNTPININGGRPGVDDGHLGGLLGARPQNPPFYPVVDEGGQMTDKPVLAGHTHFETCRVCVCGDIKDGFQGYYITIIGPCYSWNAGDTGDIQTLGGGAEGPSQLFLDTLHHDYPDVQLSLW